MVPNNAGQRPCPVLHCSPGNELYCISGMWNSVFCSVMELAVKLVSKEVSKTTTVCPIKNCKWKHSIHSFCCFWNCKFYSADAVKVLRHAYYVEMEEGYGGYFYRPRVQLKIKEMKCFFSRLHHHRNYNDPAPIS